MAHCQTAGNGSLSDFCKDDTDAQDSIARTRRGRGRQLYGGIIVKGKLLEGKGVHLGERFTPGWVISP